MIDQNSLLNSPAGPEWKNVGIKHHHGIDVPLFSLHSDSSCGIGEYPDLLLLIEWCKLIGMDVIQVLPLNDSGKDKSPYNSLSAFALNPLFLGLSRLPHLEQHEHLKEKISDLKKYNRTPLVQYEELRVKKEEFLLAYWECEYSRFKDTPDYQKFLADNLWLAGYALFKVLKERHNDAYWEFWPEEIRSPAKETFDLLLKEHERKISYHSFIQYFCYLQLKEVKDAATANQVFIMGDIPILISPDSADVWAERSIFNLDLRAGAPPDMYNAEGQAWGFPLYKWDILKQNDYSWWRRRLQYASHFYHIYRIDHIVGFFRIWGIPPGLKPKEGKFVPEERNEWISHGRPIMEMMLQSSSMLPVGEDLGTVPPEVRVCLNELGICGTKVMRWERYWEQDGSFIPSESYHPISLTTVSTHDSPTLTLWWRDYPEEAQLYCAQKGWEFSPEITREQLLSILHESHMTGSLLHVNMLNEYFALFPSLVASDPDTERVNIPGKVLDRNWTYRFVPSVEEMIAHKELNETLKSFLQSSTSP